MNMAVHFKLQAVQRRPVSNTKFGSRERDHVLQRKSASCLRTYEGPIQRRMSADIVKSYHPGQKISNPTPHSIELRLTVRSPYLALNRGMRPRSSVQCAKATAKQYRTLLHKTLRQGRKWVQRDTGCFNGNRTNAADAASTTGSSSNVCPYWLLYLTD
ncbi:hypothetical protein FKP32DRAFT_501533 [Trametes sanguinea]|nr:hypothetical protein FKP32DRAFT_501533 [Trametes sanguinea]